MANKVIAINRQFGSGGHEIGQLLSETLGIPFYDKDLIRLASERSGLHPELIEREEEQRPNRWLYAGLAGGAQTTLDNLPPADITFAIQRDIILDIWRKSDCVIVGRCSDAILREAGARVLSVFVSAPFADRVRRKMEIMGMDERDTAAIVRKTDKRRKAFYNYNSGLEWGKPENYDLCVNSTALGVAGAAEIIASVFMRL